MKASKGTYALLLALSRSGPLRAGRLRLHLAAGFYLYTGSAFGPGGLHARTAGHLKGRSRPHWHIDYLLARARVLEIWCTEDPVRREHDWAAAALAMEGATAIPRFGASDCNCPTHLLHFSRRPSHRALSRLLHRLHPGHGPVRCTRLEEEGHASRMSPPRRDLRPLPRRP